MTLSRDSLGGQNSLGRQNGARSSRALSTIFKRLQKLDREIGLIRQRASTLRSLMVFDHVRKEVAALKERHAELAALVRDARRFRKLAARYCDDASGRPTHGSIQLERWDAEWMDWVPLSDRPLAEIADALPEVEQK